MCNLSRKSFLHKVLLEKLTNPEPRSLETFSWNYYIFFWALCGLSWIAINLFPQFQPKAQLWMNLLRQKVRFLIKLFLKKPSERRWRLWTDGHSVLYECTALTSWATGPLLSILTLFITFQIKIYLKILTQVLSSNPVPTAPIKYRTIIH